jgi:hypothetical protein
MEDSKSGLTTRRRDIVIGAVVLILIAVAVYFIVKPQNQEPEITITDEPTAEERLEKSFNFDIPDDLEKAELQPVGNDNYSAVATRKYENGLYTHTIIADLPDPEEGTFYQGWLFKGNPDDSDYSIVSTGKLRIAKGGYLLDFESGTDYSDYQRVVITLENNLDDKPETYVLEGSF